MRAGGNRGRLARQKQFPLQRHHVSRHRHRGRSGASPCSATHSVEASSCDRKCSLHDDSINDSFVTRPQNNGHWGDWARGYPFIRLRGGRRGIRNLSCCARGRQHTFSVAASRSEHLLNGSQHADRRQTGHRFPSFGHRNRSFRAGAGPFPTLQHDLVGAVDPLAQSRAKIGIARVILAGSITGTEAGSCRAYPQFTLCGGQWASSAHRTHVSPDFTDCPVVNLRLQGRTVRGRMSKNSAVTLALLRQQRPELSNGKWEADWILRR